MATTALVTPLATLGVPSEQTPMLLESTAKETVSPEVDWAATVNAL
jgi:hypothetical protein